MPACKRMTHTRLIEGANSSTKMTLAQQKVITLDYKGALAAACKRVISPPRDQGISIEAHQKDQGGRGIHACMERRVHVLIMMHTHQTNPICRIHHHPFHHLYHLYIHLTASDPIPYSYAPLSASSDAGYSRWQVRTCI